MSIGDLCSIDGCDFWQFAKGYCQKHYMRQYRYGRLELAPKRVPQPCSVNAIDDCDRPIHAKGMCKQHYLANWKYGDPMISLVRDENKELASAFAKHRLDEAHDGDCPEPEYQPRWAWRKRRMAPLEDAATLTPLAKHSYRVFCRCQVAPIGEKTDD